MVTLLGRATGKIAAIARSARKSRKRFGAALAPYILAEAQLTERRGELWQLVELEALRDFPTLGGELAKMAHAAYMTELCRESLPDHAPDERTFELYREALEVLDGGEPRVELLRAFELKLLDCVGFAPRLDACARCGSLEALCAFDPSVGVVCRACGSAKYPMDESTRMDLLSRRTLDFRTSVARPMAATVNAQARNALIAFVEWHIGRRLKSVDVIAQMMSGGLR